MKAVGLLMLPCTDGVLFGVVVGEQLTLQGLPPDALDQMEAAIASVKAQEGEKTMQEAMDEYVAAGKELDKGSN